MRRLKHLLERNRNWSAKIKVKKPEFFLNLSKQQNPEYLWIGCADSRVPANQIVDLMPGEVFVHRNIANLVIHTDLNSLSVIQYAVEVLKVKHVIVCGHYGCGGVQAAMQNNALGLIDNWLRHIRDIYRNYQTEIDAVEDEKEKLNLLCEKNVIEQVANLSNSTTIQNAWKNGQELSIHGWIYSIKNGVLRDLDVCTTCLDEISKTYRVK